MLKENDGLNSFIDVLCILFGKVFVPDSEHLENVTILSDSLMLLEQVALFRCNLFSIKFKCLSRPVASPNGVWITMRITLVRLQEIKLTLKPHEYVWIVPEVPFHACDCCEIGRAHV